MLRSWSRRAPFPLGLAAWGIVVGAGVMVVHSYELTPGLAPNAGPVWPSTSRIARDPARATLVMAVHPRCPCTRASLDELARIMEHADGAVAAHVLFYLPAANPGRWGSRDIWLRAEAIPGVTVHKDPSGAESARFGAETSGTVLLYDRAGRLTFAGGITPTRGQAGENPGTDAVTAHLSGKGAGLSCSPVFGCSLRYVPTIASAP